MPALSFVLVVHREQAHLEQCVASMLEQPFADVELIAVDDASPDHGPRLLDELAERDDRAARDPPARAGRPRRGAQPRARRRSPASTSGSSRRPTAWRPERSPASRSGCATGAPDVLLVAARASADPLGREPSRAAPRGARARRRARRRPARAAARARGGGSARLGQAAPRLAAARARRCASAAASTASSPVTWPALLAADAIAASPDVGYIRRRPGNAVRDRLDRRDAVRRLRLLRRRVRVRRRARRSPTSAAGSCAESMLRHQLGAAAAGARERAARVLPPHVGVLQPPPARRRAGRRRPAARLRAALVEHDGYRAFALLESSLAKRDAARRPRVAAGTAQAPRACGARARTRPPAPLPRRGCEQPIDPDLAVFAAYWYRGYQCNPRAIYEKARELVPGMRGVWVVKADARAAHPRRRRARRRRHARVLRRARPRPLLRQQRQLPQPPRQARRHRPRDDAPRHAAQAHGARPAARDRRRRADGLRTRCCAAARAGTTASRRTSSRRWSGSASTRRPYESLEVGYPRNDVLARADDEQRAAGPRGARHPARTSRRSSTRRPTASTRPATCPCSTSRAVADALGPDHVADGAPTLLLRQRPAPAQAARRGAGPRRRGPPVGGGALPRGGRARDGLLLDHVRLRRARPPDRHPCARLGGLPRAARDLLRPARGAARRGHAVGVRARRGAALGRRRRRATAERGAGGVPRALLRARGRPAPPSASSAASGSRAARRPPRPCRRSRDERARRSARSSSSSGVGRSGTSLLAGILGQLGFHIPRPEVKANATNPRGFGEPRWVVDFHTRLLRSQRITVNDARPAAWEPAAPRRRGSGGLRRAARLARRAAARGRRGRRQGSAHGLVPAAVDALRGGPRRHARRSSRCCATRPRRSPARASPTAPGRREASRAAAWLNVTLETERATRGARRAFVRYEDLLGRLGGARWRGSATLLDLPLLRDVDRRALRPGRPVRRSDAASQPRALGRRRRARPRCATWPRTSGAPSQPLAEPGGDDDAAARRARRGARRVQAPLQGGRGHRAVVAGRGAAARRPRRRGQGAPAAPGIAARAPRAARARPPPPPPAARGVRGARRRSRPRRSASRPVSGRLHSDTAGDDARRRRGSRGGTALGGNHARRPAGRPARAAGSRRGACRHPPRLDGRSCAPRSPARASRRA